MLRGFRAQFLVNVHGEQGGAGVEHAGQRTHQGGEQSRHDDAAQARRQEMLDQQRESSLSTRRGLAGLGVIDTGQCGNLAALGQRKANQAGDDEQIDRKELQETRKNGAATGHLLIGRAQGTLNDVLVRAPIPEANDRRANGHAEPRELRVEIPGNPGRFLDRRPGAFQARRDERLPEVEHLRTT